MTKRSKPDRNVRSLDTRQLGAARGGALDAGFTLSDDFKREIELARSLLVLPALT